MILTIHTHTYTYNIALAIYMIFLVKANLPLASCGSAIQVHVRKPPNVHITQVHIAVAWYPIYSYTRGAHPH